MMTIQKTHKILFLYKTTMSVPPIPRKTTPAFALIGVILFLGSTYLNTIKENSADIGIGIGIAMIFFALFFQIMFWLVYHPSES